MSLKRLFTEHPNRSANPYVEHMGVALSFAGPCSCGPRRLVHAFLPFLCPTTASSTVKRLYARMMNRTPRPVIRPPDRMMAWDPVI